MMNLFIALMFRDDSSVLERLEKEFGAIRTQSEVFDFTFTRYYEKEFGTGLRKMFLVFFKQIERTQLPQIRMQIARIEDEYRRNGRRTVNIDPGALSQESLIVASLKQRSFKEYLGDGVYGHTVIAFRDGEVQTFSHTFADYKAHLEFFRKLR